MGDNICVMPKVKFYILAESYKQLISIEWETSSSSLFSLHLLLLLAVQSGAESAACKTFYWSNFVSILEENNIACFLR